MEIQPKKKNGRKFPFQNWAWRPGRAGGSPEPGGRPSCLLGQLPGSGEPPAWPGPRGPAEPEAHLSMKAGRAGGGRTNSYKQVWQYEIARDLRRYRKGYPDCLDAENCSDETSLDMPNFEFYMNRRRFEPNGEFIEVFLHKWNNNYDLLEKNHHYVLWLFSLREQGRNKWAKKLKLQEIELMKNTKEVQQRILEAYKMMLKFFEVRLKGEYGEVEVERAENFPERFENLNSNKLGAKQYQAPLVKFFLTETALNYFMFTMKNKQKQRHLIYFSWEKYEPRSEFIWGPREKLERYKKPYSVIAPLPPPPLDKWSPAYSEKGKKWLSEKAGDYREDGWFQLANNQIVLPN
uniref:Opioid growth factor receptor (OGFr) conserved domain-containing protein n=1 Tax=Leptobrachium leishanense TaxID=445787 RepID=A0A8C5M2Q9_9ANUR